MTLTRIQSEKLDRYTAQVMAKAHEMAMELVAEGSVAGAIRNEKTGEASCLTVTLPGDPEPYYVMPMYRDPEDMDEGWEIDLYVERDSGAWDPMPFSINVEDAEYISEDLGRLFGDFLLFVEGVRKEAAAGAK